MTSSAPEAIVQKRHALGRFAFAREFLRQPKTVAAVAPSSRWLARKMLEGLELRSAAAVVEYGPGLGTFTSAILEQIGPPRPGADGSGARPEPRLIAIERNERMAELFRSRHPEVTLHQDDAANVQAICRAEGLEQVDYVVSGLGWPSLGSEARARILVATARVLRPGGELRTFGYHCGLLMYGAWHFRRIVRRLFSEVTVSEVVWANMPPAFVYRCVR
jgi:phospholipid N-methyltransferase